MSKRSPGAVALVEVNIRSERVPFTVRLRRDLHRQVENWAHENRKSLQDAADAAFTALLSDDPADTAANLKNPLRAASPDERAVLLQCLELMRAKGKEAKAAAGIVKTVLAKWREVCTD